MKNELVGLQKIQRTIINTNILFYIDIGLIMLKITIHLSMILLATIGLALITPVMATRIPSRILA